MSFPEPKEYEPPVRKPAPIVAPPGSEVKNAPDLELAEEDWMKRKKRQMGYKQFKVNTLKIKSKGKR